MNCVQTQHMVCFVSFRFADVFKMDPDFLENEEKYKAIKKGKLGMREFIH